MTLPAWSRDKVSVLHDGIDASGLNHLAGKSTDQ